MSDRKPKSPAKAQLPRPAQDGAAALNSTQQPQPDPISGCWIALSQTSALLELVTTEADGSADANVVPCLYLALAQVKRAETAFDLVCKGKRS